MRYYARYHNPQHTYVIAEVGLCHNGSVNTAKRLIDVSVVAGADAVKFQKRTVDTLAIKSVLDAKDDRFPEFGETYRQIREHIEFGEDEYREIKQYAESKNIDFLCTAFDIEAARILEQLGVQAYKLASHSLTNLPLLEFIADLGKPTILSTGMGEWDDIDRAVDIFRQRNTHLVLLHCVSAYPTPVEKSNLTMIAALRERYNIPIGYSGHELGYVPTLAAVAMGARVVERHITLDKTMSGFDHTISLEPQELIQMVRDIRSIDKAKGKGVKQVSAQEKITSDKYHVSMVSQQPIPKGTVITPTMITYKNPGTGISPKDAHLILQKDATVDIPADEIIKPEMVA